MTPDKYQTKADKFSLYKNCNPDTLLYYAAALGGEVGELIDDAEHGFREGVIDEGGDVLWYMAAVAMMIDVRLSDVIGADSFKDGPLCIKARDIDIYCGRLLDQVKKVMRDDDGVLTITRKNRIRTYLHDMYACLNAYALMCGNEVEDMAKFNIQKLKEKAASGDVTG